MSRGRSCIDVVISETVVVPVDSERLKRTMNIIGTDIKDGKVHVTACVFSLDVVKRCFKALAQGYWTDELVEGVTFWDLLRAARAYDCLPDDLCERYRGAFPAGS